LVDAGAAGRGIAQNHRQPDPREYFYAGTAADLQKIYQNLNTRIFLEQKETEITALFAAAAAVLAFLSALLSMLWFNRIM
jgi:Ca-activated chloride channel family protein